MPLNKETKPFFSEKRNPIEKLKLSCFTIGIAFSEKTDRQTDSKQYCLLFLIQSDFIANHNHIYFLYAPIYKSLTVYWHEMTHKSWYTITQNLTYLTVYLFINLFAYTQAYLYLYICLWLCVSVYIYIYIYMYIYISLPTWMLIFS